MKFAFVLATVLLAGCTAPSDSSSTNASPSAGPTAAATASATPTPALIADQSPCRVPIAPAGLTSPAGFVSYPDGAFTADSRANALSPAAPGVPDGSFGLTYDRRYTKWLPVPLNWVSPDEGRYAYGTMYSMNNPAPTNVSLHVVDVATGSVKSVAPGDWLVVAFNVDGVYVMHQASNQAASGLSVINPDTGAIRQITSTGLWTLVKGDAAWGTLGFIPGAEAQPQLDHLVKLDLASGQILSGTASTGGNGAWFARPGFTIFTLGGDARENVIVQATSNTDGELWLVGAQTDTATQIYSGSSQGTNSLNSVYANGDGHGVWFGTQSGLYLYPNGGAVTKIASNPGQVAGACS